MKAIKIVTLFVLMSSVSGCTLIEKIKDYIDNYPPVVATPVPTVTAVPTGQPTVFPTSVPTAKPTSAPTAKPTVPANGNPIVTGPQYFEDGAGGNLWKPVSDTTGNLVIVFSSKFKSTFSQGCTVARTDGKIENLYCGGPFACYGNPDAGGDRLHMRSNIKCNQAKEVKVVCKEEKQTVTFTVKNAANLTKVCSRLD